MTEHRLQYDSDRAEIHYRGKAVISLGRAARGAPARIYSRAQDDCCGVPARFFVTGASRPFRIDEAALSAKGLLRAVVENRFEAEGMVVDDSVDEVYRILFGDHRLHWQG